MAKPFRFKQFSVDHSHTAMKVGTDGVLLGAWTPLGNGKSMLDVGTGSGLVALILAQRNSESTIEGIEIDEAAHRQATLNFKNSPWSNRLRAIQDNFLSFEPPKTYDLIVSNPPYFENSLKSGNTQRNLARHSDSLPLGSLFNKSKQLLSDEGRLSIIIPYNIKESVIVTAQSNGLFLIRSTDVFPKPETAPKRCLLLFSKKQRELISDTLTIELQNRHEYTSEYKELGKDLYLNF